MFPLTNARILLRFSINITISARWRMNRFRRHAEINFASSLVPTTTRPRYTSDTRGISIRTFYISQSGSAGLRIPDWISKWIRLCSTERPISRIRPAMFRNLSITMYALYNHHINYADDDWGRRRRWRAGGRSELDTSRIRESIFVNSTAESSDDSATRGYRLSIARVPSPGNLLVTAHVLISLSLSRSLFTHATDACASYASSPFSFCVPEYSEQPFGSE